MTAPTIGQLRLRVVIQENRATQLDRGRKVADWQPIAKRWAGWMPQSGAEYIRAKQVHPQLQGLLRMYAMPGLTEQHRVVLTIPKTRKRKTLNVMAVLDDDAAGVFMLLPCKEAEERD